MALTHRDFIALGGTNSPALLGALAAARLGRSAGILTTHAPTVDMGVIQVAAAQDAARISAQHVPYAWLDTEILLAAPEADEIDPAMLGRFSRSLIGITAHSFLQNGTLSFTEGVIPAGSGALFVDESDLTEQDAPLPAPIALSIGPQSGIRLWLQGTWQAVGGAQDPDPRVLAVLGAIFLVRLTETRAPITAARFAAAAASLLPPPNHISRDTLPDREAITAAASE